MKFKCFKCSVVIIKEFHEDSFELQEVLKGSRPMIVQLINREPKLNHHCIKLVLSSNKLPRLDFLSNFVSLRAKIKSIKYNVGKLRRLRSFHATGNKCIDESFGEIKNSRMLERQSANALKKRLTSFCNNSLSFHCI
jgi:hypothetical protein